MNVEVAVTAVAALLGTFALTGVARRLALLHGVLDVPNVRSSHARPTPRGGGVAAVIAMTAALIVLFVLGLIDAALFAALAGGGVAVALVGFIDDRRRLTANVWLLVHVVAALWALAWLGGLPPVQIAIVFASACAGFLAWNWPPAKIFMGDVGSGYLGYIIAVLALAAAANSSVAFYLEANAHGTAKLAEAAAAGGVRRFVYLSSVKVDGEETTIRPYTSADPPQPLDDYGISKWRAEQALWELASRSSVRFSIVRPTLVYGPGVRANFLRLMKWVDRQIPLPLGAVENRRSLVNV